MEAIFLKMLNMSITASWLVLAIIILRLILKKAPKAISVFMWALVGVRLICPFSFESILSLIPSAETVPQDIIYSETPAIHSGVPIFNSTVNPIISENLAPEVGASVNPMQIIAFVASVVWIAGIVAMVLYTVISYFRIHRKVREAVPYQENIWLCDHIDTPFILGVIRPRIYLPSNMNEQDIEYVIAHEKAHLKRHDHWWKPLGFLLLTVYWFNPILWIAYILLCKDIELACDEKVIKDMGTEIKKPYSEALINCSVPRKMISACPLAFGEVGVKGRVKSVLNYKKPAFWIIAVAVIASVVVAVCFLTNPKQEAELGVSSQKSGSDLNGVSLEIVDADLSAPDPYIIVEWKNDTDIKLSFGEQFAIYYNQGGTWENCSIEEDPVWNLPAYMFGANSTVKHTYKLNGQIMTHPGEYRFEAPFTIDEKNETKYSAWIEFELKEGVEGITVHTFKPIELVYDDGMYSFVQTVEGAPTYMIVNGMQLIEKTNDTVSEPIGTFEEITLNKDNFDSRFKGPTDYSWLANDTLKSLKDDNKRIWQLYGDSAAETPRLYILLEQKDGTFYLGFGYYNCNSNNPTNPDDSHIRWLYKLAEVAGNNNILTNNTPLSNFQSLKEKYPQFFNVSTDGGLKVYVWQMAENDYRCYLVNRFIDAITDQGFAFEVGATIAEMRGILTTYDVEQKDIVIHSVKNPLSSYYYEIDDTYKTNIEKLFWSTVPYVDSYQYSPIIDTATFDIDGDGKDEQCTLSAGPTSGLFTFIFSVSENGNLEYFNIFNSPYTELQFEKNAEGIMMLVGKNGEKNCYMGMDISDGNVVISSDEQEISYWGEQGLNSPYAPKTASKLNNAIAKVLKEKYRAEKPDGLVHIESYTLLANEVASGTPKVGNTEHAEEVTVYLIVFHMKYKIHEIVEEVEGDFVPTAITFSVDENGEYSLKDYWIPRSGANYSGDIRAKFPGAAADDALNIEKYAEALTNDSWSQATAYLNSLQNNN